MVLAFAFGIVCRLIKSEMAIPRDLYTSLSIYLLFALGLKGGVELSHCEWRQIFLPGIVTIAIGCITPVSAYLTLRYLGRFSIADAAGIAAHYGSVSAVTFIAAEKFVIGQLGEGAVVPFMPTLLTLLEIPGIQVALAIGVIGLAKSPDRSKLVFIESNNQCISREGEAPAEPLRRKLGRSLALPKVLWGLGIANMFGAVKSPTRGSEGAVAKGASMLTVWHELLTARSMVLLVGGMVIGFIVKYEGYAAVKPFFDKGDWMFKGALTLFLLEMGLVAGSRLADLRHAGAFLMLFGITAPVIHGALGVYLGSLAGLHVGSCTVLGAMAASASYIAAPPAVRMTLPEANPTFYLTAALAITFPFNLLIGIPLYFRMAQIVLGQS